MDNMCIEITISLLQVFENFNNEKIADKYCIHFT